MANALRDLHQLVLTNVWKYNADILQDIFAYFCELIKNEEQISYDFGTSEFWDAILDAEKDEQIGGASSSVVDVDSHCIISESFKHKCKTISHHRHEIYCEISSKSSKCYLNRF